MTPDEIGTPTLNELLRVLVSDEATQAIEDGFEAAYPVSYDWDLKETYVN